MEDDQLAEDGLEEEDEELADDDEEFVEEEDEDFDLPGEDADDAGSESGGVDPLIAALASFILPGAGQILNGDTMKGSSCSV